MRRMLDQSICDENSEHQLTWRWWISDCVCRELLLSILSTPEIPSVEFGQKRQLDLDDWTQPYEISVRFYGETFPHNKCQAFECLTYVHMRETVGKGKCGCG